MCCYSCENWLKVESMQVDLSQYFYSISNLGGIAKKNKMVFYFLLTDCFPQQERMGNIMAYIWAHISNTYLKIVLLCFVFLACNTSLSIRLPWLSKRVSCCTVAYLLKFCKLCTANISISNIIIFASIILCT